MTVEERRKGTEQQRCADHGWAGHVNNNSGEVMSGGSRREGPRHIKGNKGPPSSSPTECGAFCLGLHPQKSLLLTGEHLKGLFELCTKKKEFGRRAK